ncbi:E3 ubiquitin protein ligase DRIP2 isoform X2 [Ziziphus jujuba]|uniref:E3 ubiquitin protein ligase DRIP2 isoform X2 n=1 Tax=Ziziphus jujuba TaxID=326968 RepID=A0ABM3ZV43_ZIZJJ|nr:E3 ubiquitin protein ligase DRIP2 isoform X2 [Ziziphus jujuba]
MPFGERNLYRERLNRREMTGQVVKVKRETLEACMTCPLCHKLLKEATTISLCLHTFCRKCIYKKLSDEEVDFCPVCKIDLGCLPVEKLRPDHNLQDIRAKIFPLRRRKINAPEVTTPISLPVKRKERSLSSLVVSTPKVPIQTGLTGRRTKAVARKAAALRGCSFAVEGSIKREDSVEDHPASSSSPESQVKFTRNKMQDSSLAEPSNDQKRNKEKENDGEATEGKADLWTPLNCLVEAANRTKSSKSNTQGLTLPKSEPQNAHDSELSIRGNKTEAESLNADSEIYMPKTKMKEPDHTKVKNNSNGTTLLPGPVKRRRLRASNRNRAAPSGELCASAQVMLDASGAIRCRRNSPIWFSLVASEDRKGDVSLPQIDACYLRINKFKLLQVYRSKD